jgi:hypothetical protein
LYLSAAKYPEKFVDSIKTDIVAMSCISGYFDYPFIAELLNRGIKVVLGGSNFELWVKPEFVRNVLKMMGVKEKYLDNFIVVTGLVDLTTDIYDIIKKWKHHTITNNDFSTMWECERDYFQNILGSIRKILDLDLYTEEIRKSFTNITFLINNICWWKKCSFCGFKTGPCMDFDRNVTADVIAENVKNTMKRFNSNRVYFCNDYFIFNETQEAVLKKMKQHQDYRINIFTGVQMLQRKDYVDKINKYNIKYLKVGLEAGTDFALDYYKKGYTVADVDDMVQNLKKNLSRDVEVTLNSIIDTPQTSKQGVIQNYDNILRWKKELRESGIRANSVANTLGVVRIINSDAMIDNKFIRECRREDAQSGRIRLFNTLRSVFGEDTIPVLGDSYPCEYVPFNRYDIDGNMLPGDLDILDEETISNLYVQWGWK